MASKYPRIGLTETEAKAVLAMIVFAEAADWMDLFDNGHEVAAAKRAIEKFRRAVGG